MRRWTVRRRGRRRRRPADDPPTGWPLGRTSSGLEQAAIARGARPRDGSDEQSRTAPEPRDRALPPNAKRACARAGDAHNAPRGSSAARQPPQRQDDLARCWVARGGSSGRRGAGRTPIRKRSSRVEAARELDAGAAGAVADKRAEAAPGRETATDRSAEPAGARAAEWASANRCRAASGPASSAAEPGGRGRDSRSNHRARHSIDAPAGQCAAGNHRSRRRSEQAASNGRRRDHCRGPGDERSADSSERRCRRCSAPRATGAQRGTGGDALDRFDDCRRACETLGSMRTKTRCRAKRQLSSG